MEKTLSLSNFETFISADSLTVVDFWATWCGPCKMIAPILDEIVKETDLNLGKVNVDEELNLARKYGIQFIPTLVFFKSGQEVHRVTGYTEKRELMSLINQYA